MTRNLPAESGIANVASDMRSSLDHILRSIDQSFQFSLASAVSSEPSDNLKHKCIGLIESVWSHGPHHLDDCLRRFSKVRAPDLFLLHGILLKYHDLISSSVQASDPAKAVPQAQTRPPKSALTVQYSLLDGSQPSSACAKLLQGSTDSFESQASTLVSCSSEEPLQAQDRLSGSASRAQTITPLTSFGTSFSGLATSRDGPSTETTPRHYQLRSIPQSNFFSKDIPLQFAHSSLRVRYELQRLSANYDIELSDVLDSKFFGETCLDYDKFWNSLHFLVGGNEISRSSRHLWNISQDDKWPPELVMGGSLQAQTSKTAALKLKINPLSFNSRSNRMFRKFGSHRFFKLMIPSSADILANAQQLRGVSGDVVTRQLLQWLHEGPKELFGCKWVPIFNRPAKATKKQEKRFKRNGNREDEGGSESSISWNSDPRREVMLFAVSGPGLEPLDREAVSNFMVPLELNQSMAMCKAYSRWELSFSTTFPTLVFNPAQIIEVDDIYANGDEEDKSLHDPKLRPDWEELRVRIVNLHDSSRPTRVMTDGCGLISYPAAKKVWSLLGESGRVPSAFQGRIGPCKGVWFVESEPHSELFNENDIWLTCRSSQRKFKKHLEDYGEDYDEHRMTFEVSNWSRRMPNSKLHPDFLPILEDRGVSREVLKTFIVRNLQEQGQSARTPWSRPDRGTFDWLEENMPTDSEKNKGFAWSGPASKNNPQKVRAMAAAGFTPRSNSILSDMVKRMVKQHLEDKGRELRIGIRNSTSAIGVADPFLCLGPSEVFFFPSDPELFGTSLLANIDILVSRHPALSPCDIQRVHAVIKPELMHLRDVIVFPSTGCYPLAGKLQGGDYDGDTFWICGDQSLVQPFQNAPPTAEDPLPEDYGIAQDKRTVADIIGKSGSLDDFYQENFRFAWQEAMVGTVTNFHEKLRYHLGPNSMSDDRVKKTVIIHDLVMDAAKNGYTLTHQNWMKQISNCPRLTQEPLYKPPSKVQEVSKRIECSGSVIDYLVFCVAMPTVDRICKELDELCTDRMTHHDTEVEGLFDRVHEKYKDKPVIRSALRGLQQEIESAPASLPQRYNKAAKMKDDTTASFQMSMTDLGTSVRNLWNQYESESREWYAQLGESIRHRGKPKAWFIPFGTTGIALWDLIKASAFYRFWPHSPKMIMAMAGNEVCKLKASADPYSESVRSDIFLDMKVKKRRRDEASEEVSFEATLFGASNSESFDDVPLDLNEPVTKGPRLMKAKDAAHCFRSHRPSPLSRSFIPRFTATPPRTDSVTSGMTDVPVDDQPPEEIETEVETDDELSGASEAESGGYQTAVEDATMRNTVQQLSQGYSQLTLSDDALQ